MLQRVQKIMSNAGYCARRKAEELIKQGKVKVNDNMIHLGDKADPENDIITVDGQKLNKLSDVKRIYLLLNKPKGYIVSNKDTNGMKTIFNLIDTKEKLMAVGRLDFNTEGLIILTNDGDFANRVMHPRYEVKKTYRVLLDAEIDGKKLNKIKNGIELPEIEEGYKTRPMIVKNLGGGELEIVLHEGKNRIVRRIFEKFGFKVLSLERIKIGEIEIDDLERGKYRNLTKKEIEYLLNPKNN